MDDFAPDLGLGPAPQAPVLPPPAASNPSRSQQLVQLALMGLAGGLGPGAGTGILQGLAQATQQKQQQLRQQDQQNAFRYEQEQQNYQQQQRAFQQEQQRRQAAIMDAVKTFGSVAPTLKDKAQYDAHAEQIAGLLQGFGIRVSPNFFRSSVPFVAPSAQAKAEKAMDAFFKNPMNKPLLGNPEQMAGAFMQFDRDGDGVPEQVRISEVAEIAQMPLGTDASGKVLAAPKGTTPDQKANADSAYQNLLTIARAEGKDVDGTSAQAAKLRNDLLTKAIQTTKDASIDPTLDAVRRLALQQAQDKANAPKPAVDPQMQRRIDQKTRAFESLPIVKTVQKMAEGAAFAQSLDPNTKNPADDMALIYAFAKTMDADSAVREGEYATVQKYAQSWADQFGFDVKRLFSNTQFLTPQARANMKATIVSRYKVGKSQYDNVRKSYASQINRMTGTGDGEDYLTDYGAGFPQDEPVIDQIGARDRTRELYRQRNGGAR